MISAYNGKEPYVFISYSHKDKDKVLKIAEQLDSNGFRVWYDSGIEAGTEWPEYIAERLANCGAVIAFMSKNAQDSHNCRREINFAIELKKELLVVYLEEFEQTLGMRMQLGSLQAMYKYNFLKEADFISKLCDAKMIRQCQMSVIQKNNEINEKSVVIPKQKKRFSLFTKRTKKTDLNTVCDDTVKGNKASVALITYSEGLQYRKNSDGISCTITGVGKCEDGDIKIPPVINNLKVTHIGIQAFYNQTRLTSVIIPEGVISIENEAFQNCVDVTSVIMPSSVCSVGEYAFANCTSLEKINIPNGVTNIGQYAFSSCEKLKSINIPDGAVNIGQYAFSECRGIKSVVLPNSIKSIGESVFKYCINLSEITLPNDWTTIGEKVFYGCTGLKSITIPDGMLLIRRGAFDFCFALKCITIPSSVVAIEDGAFDACRGLTDIYYCGSKSDWAKIFIGKNNTALIKAKIHYDS